MTGQAGLGRTTLAYGGAELGARAAWFGVVLALGVLLPLRSFGAWSLLIATAGLLEIGLTLGLHGAAVRWVYDRSEADYRRALFTILVAWLACSAALTGLLDLAGARCFHWLSDDLSWPVHGRLALGLAWAGAASAIPLSMLVARQRTARFVWLRVATVLGPALGVLVALALGHRSPAGMLTGQLLGSAPFALLALGIGFTASTPRLLRHQLLPVFAFGLPVLPHVVAQWVLSWSDRWLLERLLDLDSVAVYHLAYLPGLAVLLAGGALNRAWYPGFYRELEALDAAEASPGAERFTARRDCAPTSADARALALRLGQQARTVLFLWATGGAVVALWGGELLRLLPTQGYDASPALVAPIAAGTTLGLLYLLPHNLLYHHRRTGWIPWITGTAAGLNVALNLLLIPSLGPMGAALATAVSYAAMALAYWVVAARISYLPVSRGALARAISPPLLAMAAALALSSFPLEAAPRLAVEGLATAALLLIAVLTGRARDARGLLSGD